MTLMPSTRDWTEGDELVWDAWNRLVQVGYDTGTGTQERVRYRYYPDGERAASLVDTSIKAPILPDELNLFFYDASWRLLEIRSDRTSRTDWAFPDTSASFTLSNTRQFIWGEQYIDELVAFMSDTAAAINTDGTLSTGPTFATLEYALTDRNFSVIGRGDTSNTLGDRIHYDPYGTFRAYPGGDVNRDGSTNSKDEASISNFILFGSGSSGYQAEYDLDLDGDVDSRDISKVSTYGTRTIKSGQLSDRGNIVGWCGYLYEESTGMWLARHRWQIPEIGRWANRDPIGYAGGGQNLYEYVNGNPVLLQDPSGLSSLLRNPVQSAFQMQTIGMPTREAVLLGLEMGLKHTIIASTLGLSVAGVGAIADHYAKEQSKVDGRERDENGNLKKPAKRIRCNTRKEAYERAKRDSDPGKEPGHDPHDPRGPHYHPNVRDKYSKTPKQPNNHDHYYYPKRRR
jgi:RHS repeat-associated protein